MAKEVARLPRLTVASLSVSYFEETPAGIDPRVTVASLPVSCGESPARIRENASLVTKALLTPKPTHVVC